MTPLAITGLGAVLPLGEGAERLHEALTRGEKGLRPVTDITGREGWAGRVEGFQASAYLPPMRARRLDRASLFAVAAAKQALAQAGLAEGSTIASELGVVMGTSSAGSGPLTVFLETLFRQSPEAAPPFEFPNTVANAPASHVSIELGLRGPNTTLAHSEAVAAVGLVLGGLMLQSGRCQSLLLGAVDEWSPYYQAGYAQIGALRSATEGGGGTLLTEGAAALVLEPAVRARERGAAVLARILGASSGSTLGEPYRWVADANALARVIRQALAQAGLDPDGIGSVFLAANGVAALELAEEQALRSVFGERALAASGVKGALGERAVAGVASLAAAALAHHHGVLPPFAGGACGGSTASLHRLAQPAPLPPGATLVVLQGFGGNLGAVVVG